MKSVLPSLINFSDYFSNILDLIRRRQGIVRIKVRYAERLGKGSLGQGSLALLLSRINGVRLVGRRE